MKRLVATILLFFICSVGIAGYHRLTKEGFNIEIHNQTNKDITGLSLTYNRIKKDIEIPSIKAGETYEVKVNQVKDSTQKFSEGALLLQYEGNQGHLHTEYVIGYFEKGYTGDASIDLESIDDDGKIHMKIKENTSLY